MKLKPKFILNYLIISLIVLIFGIVNYAQLFKLQTLLDNTTNKYAPALIDLSRVEHLSTRIREEAISSALLQIAGLYTGREVSIEFIEEENGEFEENFELLTELLEEMREAQYKMISEEDHRKLNASVDAFYSNGRELINIGLNREKLDDVTEYKEGLEKAEEDFYDVADEITQKYKQNFENSRQAGLKTINNSIIFGWIGTLGAIVLSIILGNISAARIVNPLLNLIRATKDIRKGKYEIKDMKISHDEIGQLHQSFTIMAGALGEKTDALLNEIKVREESEKQTDTLNKKLESKNEELERIIYGLSHDLRSPLINITGYSDELINLAEILKQEVSSDLTEIDRDHVNKILNEEFNDSIEFIQMSAKKIDTVLNGLLQLARLESFMLSIEKQNMNDLLVDVTKSHNYLLKENKINLIIEDLPDCLADVNVISQLFANLISNAIKYSDPEKESFIKISGYNESGNSVYIVEDNGIGIREKDISKIFDIFFRGKMSSKDGYGLGLAIVKRIIELHKGQIWVESKVGVGSKFFVSIPNNSSEELNNLDS